MTRTLTGSVFLKTLLISTALIVSLGASEEVLAGPDLFIRDQPSDTGVEPNPSNDPYWVSDDIWVRSTPDPNYLPDPFQTNIPTWTPQLHENPEYRDTAYSTPNYVYVRVHNRGDAATSGEEVLRVYAAKASTGLNWPTQWVDHVQGGLLYGGEVTKPRKNAALATQAERDAFVSAIIATRQAPHILPDSTTSAWHMQGTIHAVMSALTTSQVAHGNPAFLPWHREMVNRLEHMLQKADPTVKLLYWDWTTDPANAAGGFNYFSNTFMGASGRASATPVSIGAPFMTGGGGTDPSGGPTVRRRGSSSLSPPANYNGPLGQSVYNSFRAVLEQSPHHNQAHPYIGGNFAGGSANNGNISFLNTAAQDPFFFLLHTNVDRVWAEWQRAGGHQDRLTPATAYDASSSAASISANMTPWDGGAGLNPWTGAAGYAINKASRSPSLVNPPAYDTAMVKIPVLQPGQSAIVEVPWYPPNPASFASFGADAGHFCLLARIETSPTAPFGIATAEGVDVNTNTRNNNNIAWKNVTVVDNFPGALRVMNLIVRNAFEKPVTLGLRLEELRGDRPSLFKQGAVTIDLGEKLYARWQESGASAEGVEKVEGNTVRFMTTESRLLGIKLDPGEEFNVAVKFELSKEARPRKDVLGVMDIVQIGSPDDEKAVVGGQRFELRYSKVVGIEKGGKWLWNAKAEAAPEGWTEPSFDDKDWQLAATPFGTGKDAATIASARPLGNVDVSQQLRKRFAIDDLAFFDRPRLRVRTRAGIVVHVNGKEVYRENMAEGIVANNQFAEGERGDAERQVYRTVKLPRDVLRRGENVVAVQVFPAKEQQGVEVFDFELTGRELAAVEPPEISFAQPADGDVIQAGSKLPVQARAASAGSKVVFMEVLVDGKQVAENEGDSIFYVVENVEVGRRVLSIVARDASGQTSSRRVIVNAVASAPASVAFTNHKSINSMREGEALDFEASAVANGDKVDRIEFELMSMDMMADPVLVATVKEAPYRMTLKDVAPGNYMLTAVAVTAGGTKSYSTPVHVHVSMDH